MKTTKFVSTLAVLAILSSAGTAFAAGDGFMGGKRGGEKLDFAAVDTNGDGQISQEEIDAYKAATQAARFAEIDADGDGGVSLEELTAFREAKAEEAKSKRLEKMSERFEKMFAAQDANGDGVLSLEELGTRPQMTMFERLDANGDGLLSEEELENAKRGGRKGGGHMGGDRKGG